MLQPLLKTAKAISDYRLVLEYTNGECKIFDVKPYIEGPWFSELFDEKYFSQVNIIDDGYGIMWPHGQDIAPHELYELSK